MNNLNKITKVLGATFVLVACSGVSAQTLTNQPATATVQNTFLITPTTALDFGTVRASNDTTVSTNIATMLVSPLGVVTYSTVVSGNTAAIFSLSTPTPARFDITGAAPFTNLYYRMPALTNRLEPDSAPASTAGFVITAWVAQAVDGINDGDTIADDSTLQTDSTGAVGLLLGASLTTDNVVGNVNGYGEGGYSGTYTFEIEY